MAKYQQDSKAHRQSYEAPAWIAVRAGEAAAVSDPCPGGTNHTGGSGDPCIYPDCCDGTKCPPLFEITC